MRSVELQADTFEAEAFHVPEIEAAEYQSPALVDVKLLFLPRVAYRVYDEFDERDIVKNEDGSATVSMRLPGDYWLYDYILSFGVAIEVLEPQSVRDEIVRLIEEIKSKYAG